MKFSTKLLLLGLLVFACSGSSSGCTKARRKMYCYGSDEGMPETANDSIENCRNACLNSAFTCYGINYEDDTDEEGEIIGDCDLWTEPCDVGKQKDGHTILESVGCFKQTAYVDEKLGGQLLLLPGHASPTCTCDNYDPQAESNMYCQFDKKLYDEGYFSKCDRFEGFPDGCPTNMAEKCEKSESKIGHGLKHRESKIGHGSKRRESKIGHRLKHRESRLAHALKRRESRLGHALKRRESRLAHALKRTKSKIEFRLSQLHRLKRRESKIAHRLDDHVHAK